MKIILASNSPRRTEILKNETGINIYVINPVTSGEASLTAYEDIMKENYELILKAVK